MRAIPDCSITIKELCERAYENSAAKGFHDNYEDTPERFSQRLMLIVSELVEAMEERRTGHAPNELYYGEKTKPEGVPAEIADVFIRLGDLCTEYRIDIERAIIEKMLYNATRPRMHGGKLF